MSTKEDCCGLQREITNEERLQMYVHQMSDDLTLGAATYRPKLIAHLGTDPMRKEEMAGRYVLHYTNNCTWIHCKN